MKWLKNNGSESFTTINIKTGIQAFDIHAADMNNDGDIDILVSMNDYTNSSIYGYMKTTLSFQSQRQLQ